MDHQRVTRRSLIGAGVATGLVSISGCLGAPSGDSGVDGFEYPTGFYTDGIEAESALGMDSAMASIDSAQVSHERVLSMGGGTVELDYKREIDAVSERFTSVENRFDDSSLTLTHTEGFFDGEELIERVKVEPRSLGFSHRAEFHDFSPTEAYRLDEIRELIAGVDLTAQTPDHTEDDEVVIYRAKTSDFTDHSAVSQIDADVDEASIELVVDTAGYIRSSEITVSFAGVLEDQTELIGRWEFTDFGTISVERPDWVDELDGLERPEVDVVFDESVGEAVTVEIESMINTDQVAIVLQQSGVYADGDEPFSMEIPVEDYLTDEDAVQTILVFAENDLRGPMLIDSYQPTAPE